MYGPELKHDILENKPYVDLVIGPDFIEDCQKS